MIQEHPILEGQPSRTDETLSDTKTLDSGRTESPVLVHDGDRTVLFGPGLDDFNELDDPC